MEALAFFVANIVPTVNSGYSVGFAILLLTLVIEIVFATRMAFEIL